MRRVLAVLAALAVLFAGCAAPTDGGTVEPGTGPAASSESTEEPIEEEPTLDEGTMEPSETPTEELGDETPEDPAEDAGVASFKEKYRYPDGLIVEVIRAQQHSMTDSDYASGDEPAGTPYKVLSVRIMNGTKARLDATEASATLTYGPDGEESSSVAGSKVPGMTGSILPGRAKTSGWGFIIPKKYLGDVQFEFTPDWNHEPAIFAGSVK